MPVLSLVSPYAASDNATNIQVPETRETTGKICLDLGLMGVKCMYTGAADCEPADQDIAN